ncbi:MAG TPA: phosphatase PAP2 family protein [Gaiellaceae bacterium]|nr:phosphatase PAP2 family protein [Gaiellaceae bacterium]
MSLDLHWIGRRLHSHLAWRGALASPHRGAVEVVALFGLYGLYELVRGFGELDFAAAHRNTANIVALEQRLNVFGERSVQNWAQGIPGLPSALGFAYIAFHLVLTAAVLVWVYRAHRDRFPLVRTTLILSTAIALVGYVVYPAAPPRLSNLGFVDTVSEHGGINLSSDLLGSFYNPIAAVPSLHFGYALLVGAAVAAFARSRIVRAAGAAYPAVMLFIIVATGNHFLFDAVAGGIVIVVAWVGARLLVARPAASSGQVPALAPRRHEPARLTRLAA